MEIGTLMRFKEPMTHGKMMEYLNLYVERYRCCHVAYLGESTLGRSIPLVTLGKGQKTVMYIGAHHGMEWITTSLLLKFICEYCEMLDSNGHIGHTSVSYLNASRRICIIPMLNPDGVEYQISGISEDNPIRDRLIKMNSGSLDFSKWQANARGVDLNHNYDADFYEYKNSEQVKSIECGAPTKWCGEAPESETESGILANFARFNDDIELFLSFHTQGEEIYYGDRFSPPGENIRIGKMLARLSGYKLSETEGTASSGGFTDWAVKELRKPSYTIECGKGENPLPVENLFEIYCRLRGLLFESPMLI